MRGLAIMVSVGILAAASWAGVVAVDPSGRLAGATVLGEWSAVGGLEGWTGSNVTGLAATNGCLVGTDASGSADASVSRSAMSGGPDLDLGFNDYLQIRIKVPAAYTNDVRIEFGTTVKTGFATDRRVTIPAVSVVRDGAFHTYRLDLGLEVWWRDTLRDIRITPLLSATGGFEIDYVEVGDVAGSEPALNLNTNFKSGLSAANTGRLAGKHICVWWDLADASFTTNHARRAIRMCEESYQVFCNKLGYSEPFYEFDNTNTACYKVNFVTWYDGFWAGGYANRSHLNIGSGGLADEGWGNPAPHEFGHCVQMAQAGRLVGGHWESHANYLRAGRNLHFYAAIPSAIPAIDNLTGNSNYRPDHLRHIYADQRYWLSLDDYGSGFGLPENYAAVAWRDGARDKTIMEKLAASLPGGTSVKDVSAECMKRWPMLDFVEKTRIRAQHWGTATARAEHFWRQGARLVPQQDKPGWWRVPFERAPDKWAYMAHDLSAATGRTVTVEVRGFDLSGTGEDWRWCLAAVATNDTVRYTPVMAPGTTNITLAAGETNLFLIVAATPSGTALDLDSLYNTKPTDKHADRLRYAYEVRLTNALPAAHAFEVANPSGYHLHANGGGVVGPSATVDASAYVGPGAKVLETAKVLGSARVEDGAVVQGSAIVQGSAVVSGCARVYGSAVVQDSARVRDRAEVRGSSVIKGRARVAGYACVEGATVQDDAAVRGCAFPFGGTISGTAVADHDYSMDFSFSSGAHFGHIPWGAWFDAFYTQTLRTPRGLFASYRTEESSGQVWWDEFGAQHALLRGSPSRATDAFFQSAVLALDGTDDYAALDRSVADAPRFSFAGWFKPARAPGSEEPLLFLGSSATRALKLVRNAAGKPALSLSNGASTFSLTGLSVLGSNAWRHVAVTLDGSTGRLYVDGKQEASGATSLTPLSALATNDASSAQANYVGRDWAGALFKGSVEDVRFHAVALTDAEVREGFQRRGCALGLFYPSAAADFNGSNSVAQSGVRNGRVRTLAAWAKPRSSGDVSNYEALFDSDDERDGSRAGSGLGLDAGRWVARLDGLGNWDTGATAALGQWQHVALAFTGSSATFYVNGAAVATRTYTGPSSDSGAAGKCYRIGFSQTSEDTATRQYYDGLLLCARVYDRALAAGEFVFDTDGDGVNDNVETDFGTDPIDPLSTPPQYAVSGAVADRAGAGVTNATVYFSQVPGARSNAWVTASAGAGGLYSRLLTPGVWYVTAAAAGYNASTERVVTVSAAAVPGVDFSLAAYARVSGAVTRRDTGAAAAGASVWFSRAPGASAGFLASAAVSAQGEYSATLEDGAWYVAAGGAGYYTSEDQAVALAGADTPNVSFALNPQSFPRTNDLLFAALTDALPAGGATGSWPTFRPSGQTMTAMGSPAVETTNGAKWVRNVYVDGDGFLRATSNTAIPVNGVTVVVAARPQRNATSTSWTSLVDLFYNRVVLGIRNSTGKVDVLHNGSQSSSTAALPDGQRTVLSLVVQPSGTYKVYTNGNEIMSVTSTSSMTSLVPNVAGSFANALNVGRNNPDGWTTFNGLIGDVFVYTNALSAAERQQLEGSLLRKFVTAALAQPAGLIASNLTATGVVLRWQDQASGETGYRVERRLAGSGSWTLLATLAAGATSFADAGLADGAAYEYRVQAAGPGEYGALSALAVATPSLAAYRIPFAETFETEPDTMAHEVGPLAGQHGWEAAPLSCASVQSNAAFGGARAAALTSGELRHAFLTNTVRRAWFDFALRARRTTPGFSCAAAQTSSATFYLGEDGRVVALDGAAWRVLAGFTARDDEWVRYTVGLDYAARTWALFAAHEAPGSRSVALANRLAFASGSAETAPREFRLETREAEPTLLDSLTLADEVAAGVPPHVMPGALLMLN